MFLSWVGTKMYYFIFNFYIFGAGGVAQAVKAHT
jgi:hypothetical protein